MVNSISPFPETADIETSSEEYASRFSGETGEWFLRVQEQATLSLLGPLKQAKILDVGGGHGQLTGALIEKDYEVSVVGSAEICKARIQSFIDKKKVSFKVGDVLDLPYDDREFEVVISYRLLSHVNRWQKFLTELTRVASKSVIVDYPEKRSFNAFTPYLFDLKKDIEGNTRTYKTFREPELMKIFHSQNFVKGSRFAEFFLPMVLHRKMNSQKISASVESVFRSLGLTNLFGSPIILKVDRKVS